MCVWPQRCCRMHMSLKNIISASHAVTLALSAIHFWLNVAPAQHIILKLVDPRIFFCPWIYSISKNGTGNISTC